MYNSAVRMPKVTEESIQLAYAIAQKFLATKRSTAEVEECTASRLGDCGTAKARLVLG